MASAILVSRNETSNFLSTNHHLQPSLRTMGKLPYLNPNPNPNFTSNNNTNNNSFSKKQLNNHQNGNHHNHNHHQISEDVLSLNHHHHHHQLQQQQLRKSSANDVTPNGATSFSHYINYDISTLSKSEIRTLKTRFISELDKVRSLSTRIDSGEFNLKKRPPPPFQPQSKDSKRGKHHHQQPPPPQPPQVVVASQQVMKMCSNALSKVMKQKAGYVFNEPVDVIAMGLHDYHTIIKRPMDLGTIKRNLANGVYNTPEEFAADVRLTFNNALKYNPKGHEVHTLAERFLVKFEQIYGSIQQKYNVEKFQNRAQVEKPVLNRKPKTDWVMGVNQPKVDWGVAKTADVVVVDEVQGSSWSRNPSPESHLPPPKVDSVPKKAEPRAEVPQRVVEVPQPQPRVEPLPRVEASPRVEPAPSRVEQRVEAPQRSEQGAELVHTPLQEVVRSGTGTGTGRGSGGKLPKPKAKDPNKREMNMEEKHKLGAGLQSLPEEKMTQVIQIIRKRNGHLTQDGDEIELDIEAVDTETLWELDRFVTNYKKMVSKLRRQALMDMQNNNVGHQDDDSNQVGVGERAMETSKAVKRSGGGGDVGEEDVDIGDEMPVHNFPPVEIDKDDDRHQGGGGGGGGGGGDGGETSDSSSSSSSGSDSSSSSDSDSGSSSGSDSDVDDAQSRDNESKNIPH